MSPSSDESASGAPEACLAAIPAVFRQLEPTRRAIGKHGTFREVRRPFGGISSDDRRVGLPHQHPPLSAFLTLSAAFSHRNLAALFRAASTPRILVFRALIHPSQP